MTNRELIEHCADTINRDFQKCADNKCEALEACDEYRKHWPFTVPQAAKPFIEKLDKKWLDSQAGDTE